ncbi:MAG: hypothetical protein SPI03_03730 [Campylobacter sputorum]|uniref:hypothetical protein n=1 Tax=Campylobacter sputorum TaxID=206 RepID=UPI002A90D308|nr:hypothetical protein [Campylobacter sputorum]MDY6120436.1 hypothetical protein [Campylobacter sputorum]
MKVHYLEDTKEIYGYYQDTDTNIPEPNITITKEEWQEAIEENATHIDLSSNTLYKELPQPSLDELKILKILEFHELRDKENIANYEFENHTYSMNLQVQSDILATLTIFDKDNFITGYTLKDIITGEYIPFDYTKLQQLSREVAIRKATLVFKTQKLEDAVNKCNTKQDLELIKW